MSTTPGIIDCYVNSNPPEHAGEFDAGAQQLFARSRTQRGMTAEEMVGAMDQHGIERCLLGASPLAAEDAGQRWVLQTIERYPDRFAYAARVDPRQGMAAVRALEHAVKNDGAIAGRLVPMRIGLPPNDKIYFPVYSKCCELEIPVTLTVGLPGPLVPGEMQRPIYLDEVCYLMPELKVVSTHGGEPWTEELVKLLLKWPNLYHMISAFRPRYYPRALIDFLNTRGASKVLFASDYPAISWERAIPELSEVPLKDEVRPQFLRENALRVFPWRNLPTVAAQPTDAATLSPG